MTKKLLILDDDLRLTAALSREFGDRGYEVFVAHGIESIPSKKFDFALIDIRLVGELGLSSIPLLKKNSPNCRIVVLSGYGSVTTAVEAMKLGATDYLRKPSGVDEIEVAFSGRRKQQAESDLAIPSLSEVEQEYIDLVLTRNEGNITKTAKDLGLHRQSLQRKLKKYS